MPIESCCCAPKSTAALAKPEQGGWWCPTADCRPVLHPLAPHPTSGSARLLSPRLPLFRDADNMGSLGWSSPLTEQAGCRRGPAFPQPIPALRGPGMMRGAACPPVAPLSVMTLGAVWVLQAISALINCQEAGPRRSQPDSSLAEASAQPIPHNQGNHLAQVGARS